MVQFGQLLTRANDLTLQELLGRDAVKLIRLLAGQGTNMAVFREALATLKSPAEMLRDSAIRETLMDLLRPAEAAALAADLGLPTDHPYQHLREYRHRCGSDQEASLFRFFEVEDNRTERETFPPNVDSCAATYPLFEYQRDAARRVADELAREPHRVLLHMPTGSGKTRTAMTVIARALVLQGPCVVLWLAYSEELCEQAATEFRVAWSSIGDREIRIYRFWGEHRIEGDAPDDGLIVAGLGKLFAAAKASIGFIDRLRANVRLVVMDEAHQAVAETYNTLLDVLLASNQSALLGLTATPGRTWNDPAEDERLSRYFVRRKVTLRIPGHRNPVEYLIDSGYLARPSFRPLLYQAGYTLTATDLAAIAEDLEIPPSVLKKLEDDEQRNLCILRNVEVLSKHHRRIIVFAVSVQNARLLAAVLRSRGLAAFAITAATADADRSSIIGEFRSRSGPAMVLFNYGVLTAGFDAPATSAVIIARPTKSLVLFSQMVGRGIRGKRAGGNAYAEIHIVQDPQLPGFGDVAQAFYNWEDVWTDG